MVNVMIADDHVVLREALAHMLNQSGTYKVVGQAKDGEELLQMLRSSSRPDIVIMDIAMPRLDGFSALQAMSGFQNPPPVLVLSANENEVAVRAALKAGAKGFIPKQAGVAEFDLAINSIIHGKTYISPSVTEKLMSADGDVSLENPFAGLTKRELEIVRYLANGMPNREIGKTLHISTRTVDTHRSNILKKLKVRTNAELVKLAITHHVIEI